jgi:hypothetical protein
MMQLAEQIDAQLTKAIETFDWTGEIEMEISHLLPQLARKSMREAIQRALWDEEVKGSLDRIARQAVEKVLDRPRQ